MNDFVDAIWRVKTAGFDGVELHAAHAYLLSSFLSPLTNKRTDQYGGSLEKRVHIIRAIMDKARKRVGPDFPIMIKVNSDDNVALGIRPENFPALANEIVKTGVVAFDVSGNNCLQEGIEDIEDEAYFLHCILDFFESTLENNPVLDQEELAAWLAERRHQINHNDLVYIAHQLDFLGSFPQ